MPVFVSKFAIDIMNFNISMGVFLGKSLTFAPVPNS